MPLMSQNLFLGKTLQVQSSIWSEPIAGAYGRRQQLWAVNGIGGATRLNGMIWTRGSPENYRAWGDLGLDDWTWDRVEPYFRKLENVVSAGSLNEFQKPVRGHDGPIKLRKPQYHYKWLSQ